MTLVVTATLTVNKTGLIFHILLAVESVQCIPGSHQHITTLVIPHHQEVTHPHPQPPSPLPQPVAAAQWTVGIQVDCQ